MRLQHLLIDQHAGIFFPRHGLGATDPFDELAKPPQHVRTWHVRHWKPPRCGGGCDGAREMRQALHASACAPTALTKSRNGKRRMSSWQHAVIQRDHAHTQAKFQFIVIDNAARVAGENTVRCARE